MVNNDHTHELKRYLVQEEVVLSRSVRSGVLGCTAHWVRLVFPRLARYVGKTSSMGALALVFYLLSAMSLIS